MNTRSMTKRFNQPQQHRVSPFGAMHLENIVDEAEKKASWDSEEDYERWQSKIRFDRRKVAASARRKAEDAAAAYEAEKKAQRQWESNLKKEAVASQKKALAYERKAQRQWESNLKKEVTTTTTKWFRD